MPDSDLYHLLLDWELTGLRLDLAIENHGEQSPEVKALRAERTQLRQRISSAHKLHEDRKALGVPMRYSSNAPADRV